MSTSSTLSAPSRMKRPSTHSPMPWDNVRQALYQVMRDINASCLAPAIGRGSPQALGAHSARAPQDKEKTPHDPDRGDRGDPRPPPDKTKDIQDERHPKRKTSKTKDTQDKARATRVTAVPKAAHRPLDASQGRPSGAREPGGRGSSHKQRLTTHWSRPPPAAACARAGVGAWGRRLTATVRCRSVAS